jgi:Protein of unknown function DUF2834
MPRARRLLCVYYGFLALLALIGTWSHNVAYLRPGEGPIAGFVGATMRFWPDTLATPASTSITVDIGIFLLAFSIWMLTEARRLAIRLPWLYVIGGLLIAISVTAPLFLIARERALAARGESADTLGLGHLDVLGLFVLGGAFVTFTLWTLV